MSIKSYLARKQNGEQKKEVIADEAVIATFDITGYLEFIESCSIVGWVANKTMDEDRLEVEILADGYPILHVKADNFRDDLKKAGYGDGKHGFNAMLPEFLFDGKEHVIEVREVSSGYQLHGSPANFQGTFISQGNVALEGSALVGWARLPEHIETEIPLQVYEGGMIIASGYGIVDDKFKNIINFRISLPAPIFDGRPHCFSVSAQNQAMVFGQLAIITPFMLTPESALRQYAREGLRPCLSVMAGFRYESFTKRIEQLTSNTLGAMPENEAKLLDENEGCEAGFFVGEQIAQLVHAHNQVVRGFTDTDKKFKPLIFPKIQNPIVSIVIPVHNKFPVTYHCLSSLLLAMSEISFEVIIVDDGSKDESTFIPKLIKGVQYIRNDEAQGFIRACNLGGEYACGNYIVMLNNDTEVTSGWLDELLWPFENFEKVGMTGAKLLYPDGTLQDAGGIVWNSGDPWNYGRQANPCDPRYNYARQVDYLSGACIMLARDLWNELGGFDEAFVPAYFEDTDLAFRVREKGYKTIYVPLSQVIHYEGISSGTNTASGTKRYQQINRPKFKKRWMWACRNNGKVGVDIELNKDRNVEFRALVLDAETPMPDQNAGSYAAIQEMRLLQALGFKCTFVPSNLAWMGHYTQALQRMGVECLYAPFTSSINEVIQTRGSEFDLIYITRYYVAQHYIDLIRHHAPQARIILNNADLHFLRELRAGLQAKSREVLARAVTTRDEELATMRKVDLVLSYTDVEKAVILSHNLDSTRVAKCPWVTDVLSDMPGFEGRSGIAFLGGYNHHPNVEAVEWFVREVMPLLRKTLHGVKFNIYGSNIPDSIQSLAEKNDDLIIKGWVANVDAVYNYCRVFIAPLQSGAGIKGKVIGAFAHGVPCILSSIAAEGIPFSDGIDARIADNPEEWVSALSALYKNPIAWDEMSRKAIAFAQKRYGFEKGLLQMREALQGAEIYTNSDNNTFSLR